MFMIAATPYCAFYYNILSKFVVKILLQTIKQFVNKIRKRQKKDRFGGSGPKN